MNALISLIQKGTSKQTLTTLRRWSALVGSLGCFACFAQAPANDNFTNAIVVYGNSAIFSGTVSNATFEAGEPETGCGWDFPGGSVWWLWTATNTTAVVIDVIESTGAHSAGLSVDTGSDPSALTDIDCTGMDSINHRFVRFDAIVGTTYHIRVWGRDRSFTLRLTGTNGPVVLSPPQSQTVAEAASAMFGVIAAGVPPLSYQWQFAGNPMPGQIAPVLLLHYLTQGRAGDYSVVVSNASGTVTSAVANLTISPTSPPLLLAPVDSPDKSHFSFSLAGETGRFYRIWSTTNMVDWADEPSLDPLLSHVTVVQNTNTVSVYSIPIDTPQKCVRASHFMNREICIAQLQAIYHAMKLWAIYIKYSDLAIVTEQDVAPYLPGTLVCPSGGTSFADSYSLTMVGVPPTCIRVPELHVLPP